jgi:aminopeptidase N
MNYHMIKKIAALILALNFQTAFGQVPQQQAEIDVQHYEFSLTINDSNNILKAKATIRVRILKKTSRMQFDLVGLNGSGKGMVVSKAMQNDAPVFFIQQDDKIILDLNQPAEDGEEMDIIIDYHGIPADGLIYSQNKFGHRTIFGDNWPNRARNWLVCVDKPSDKATVDFGVTAPEHYQVVANGIQTEETSLGNNLRYTHWKESVPLPTKVMTIGLADFAVSYAGDAMGIPVYSWVYPEDRQKGFYDYGEAVDILSYFIKQLGSYPYKKLANVQSKTIFGGMENANCIFYSEYSVSGKGRAGDLLAHEIAHQWFGDTMTETDFSQLWLSEGFATYMANLFLEHKYGRDTLIKRLRVDRDTVISFSRRNKSAVVDSSTNYMSLLNANSYQKGGWVLHMLRIKMGDSLFWRSIRDYYQKFREKNASTSDLQKIMEKEYGSSLDFFFKQWIFHPGLPSLSVTWSYEERTKQVFVKIIQTQERLFHFPLEISIQTETEPSFSRIFEIAEKSNSFSIKVNGKPTRLQLDPQTNLLFEGTFTQK